MEWVLDIINYANRAVAAGGVLALFVVCLLQYGFYLWRLSSVRMEQEFHIFEKQELKREQETLNRNLKLSRLELKITNELVSQTDFEKAIDTLLRRLAPSGDAGFGAVLECHNAGCYVTRSRGLSPQSVETFCLDNALLNRVRSKQIVFLEGRNLFQNPIIGTLSAADRGKLVELCLMRIGEPGDLSGVLVTTRPFPPLASREAQKKLTGRLMSCISVVLQQQMQFQAQADQLVLSNYMLELRSVSDTHYDSPLKMLEEFLHRLAGIIGADRATLFLASRQSSKLSNAFVRTGKKMQSVIERRWQAHEDSLAETTMGNKEIQTFEHEELKQKKIDTLIGTAAIVPIIGAQGVTGTLCFTKASRSPFDSNDLRLSGWAGQYLSGVLITVMEYVRVEQQAKRDGLTGLANRREFDARIVEEVQRAADEQSDCALLLFDLDHFKSINDTYGHQAGDEVLRYTAKVLQEQIKRVHSDDRALVARYGGEEMVVLLPEIGAAGAHRIAETMRQALAEAKIPFQNQLLQVTLSVGVAVYPSYSSNADELVAAADAALYQAKQTGRNRVCSVAESFA